MVGKSDGKIGVKKDSGLFKCQKPRLSIQIPKRDVFRTKSMMLSLPTDVVPLVPQPETLAQFLEMHPDARISHTSTC